MIRVHLAGKGVFLSYATDFRVQDGSGRLVVERYDSEDQRTVVAVFNAGAWVFVERCGGEQLADSAADSEADEPGV